MSYSLIDTYFIMSQKPHIFANKKHSRVLRGSHHRNHSSLRISLSLLLQYVINVIINCGHINGLQYWRYKLTWNHSVLDCGVHQSLDIVFVYNLNVTPTDFYYQMSFITSLADLLYLHADHTNIAGIGLNDSAHYGWGLRDYFTSTNISTKMNNITTGVGNGTSDLSPAIDMAWNNILSKNTRPGSTPWLFVITDTSTMSTTTSLNAIKAAGIKVGFLTTLSASNYTSYASDSRYIVAGMSWWTITSYVSQVVTTLFCPECKFLKWVYF